MIRFGRSMRMSGWVIAALVLSVTAAALVRGEQENPLARGSAAAGNGTRLTIEQIGEALEKYGKSTTTNNGHTDYSLEVHRGKWNINVIVSLSPNGKVIWMTNNLTKVPDAGSVSPAALLNVLKKNQEIGPMFFSIAYDSLRISNPVPNHDLTVDGVQGQVDALVSTVLDTEALWKPETLARDQRAPRPEGAGNGNPLSK